MCVLSFKLLFGGTDWIENWRRGDKHKLGFSPKKNKNIRHYRISLSLQCVGELHVVMITISESFILYLRNTPFLFSAKFPIVLPSWPWSRNMQASEESLNDKKAYPKWLCNYGFALFVVLIFQYRWDEKFWVMKSFESTFFAIYTFQLTGWLLVRASNDFVALFDENLLCAFLDISPAQVFRFPVCYRV